ncbi:MAG TPA: bifunctional lysylphosphatidylglycerol flippase/synthetase MprF [Sphingopyxis sp.]|uniref:bifunctional lysylphosphatidylglycerol flippase/synthetase MprF n=1 Tax=Sphingopyxis sp. TaxID=1908224 RepID=UPI002C593967|nr:bifunctional lysylphosphatidylglycerol flippase/synthetase MprF [Sphingopyxis sp.]HWW57333.1 bifunctional lysylphosphatidylglycerol flippase/synthetase MprF [Sphingopyxis sp.]
MTRPGNAVEWIRRNRRPVSIGTALMVAALGLAALFRLLHSVRPHEIRHAFDALSAGQIGAALLLTAASYAMLTLYDRFALRTIDRPLPWRTWALAAFTSYTLSHNLGLALLTGGSARYRIYRAAGLSGGEIGSVIALASLSFWNGVLLLAGLAAATSRQILPFFDRGLSLHWLHLAGLAVLTLCLIPLLLRHFGVKAIEIGGWRTPLPNATRSAAMTAVAAFDLAAASAALFVLLPAPDAAAYPVFFLGYALAIIAALISHVPGGLGVFEAVVIAAVPGDKAQLLAALLAYRVIYYLLPLLFAALLLVWHEGKAWRQPARQATQAGQSLLRELAPPLLAALVFAGGLILLLSGATPAEAARMHELRHFLPLPFVEASHIAASLSGTLLLFLAPGLLRRLDGAFVATRALLVAAIIFSLAKGGDYEEALVLSAIGAALQWSRPAFYRTTSLLDAPLSTGWIAAALTAVMASAFAGFFAYKHVAYTSSLWWQFTLNGDAPRFLRALFGIAVLVAGLALWQLFAPSPRAARDRDIAFDQLGPALAVTDHSDAFLAWTGDKQFLLANEGDAFLMYRVQGANWIVMGNPVGREERWPDLLWRLRERADAAQGRVLLYQISAACLPPAIDLGLSIVKYGEEARVDLATFSLAGPHAKSLRHAERRAIEAGATFDIIAAADVPHHLTELEAVSNDWLDAKKQREKAFSLGSFGAGYMQNFPCAVVRVDGRIIAFANILATPNREEISVDLMRHRRDIPYGVMDFLFVRLIRHAQAEAYRWFTLGVAPLAGIDGRKLAPAWARGAAFLFRHGESFYGFEGLRNYKAKFATHWEPRYIAGPRGMAFAFGIAAVHNIVSRPVAKRRPVSAAMPHDEAEGVSLHLRQAGERRYKAAPAMRR